MHFGAFLIVFYINRTVNKIVNNEGGSRVGRVNIITIRGDRKNEPKA